MNISPINKSKSNANLASLSNNKIIIDVNGEKSVLQDASPMFT